MRTDTFMYYCSMYLHSLVAPPPGIEASLEVIEASLSARTSCSVKHVSIIHADYVLMQYFNSFSPPAKQTQATTANLWTDKKGLFWAHLMLPECRGWMSNQSSISTLPFHWPRAWTTSSYRTPPPPINFQIVELYQNDFTHRCKMRSTTFSRVYVFFISPFFLKKRGGGANDILRCLEYPPS